MWALMGVPLFGLLGARLYTIQITRHEFYTKKAEETRGRRWPIPAPRGNIYDRNGTPLALNLKVFSVAADPKLVPDPVASAARLEPLLRIPKEEILDKLTTNEGSRYVKLRETVDRPVADAIRRLRLPGLIVNTEWKRAYPHGGLAAGLIGFVGKDGDGLGGVEAAANERLAGRDGEALVVLDGRLPRSRSQIPGRTVVTREMEPGSSLTLTIDIGIQTAAEEELARAVEEANASGGTAIVMDPETGEILALAAQPNFDPNEFLDYEEDTWVSRAVSSPYEPGSTFKMVTACAAIEEGVMSNGETYHCTGSRPVGRRTISCALHGGSRAHGTLDLDHMVIESCNVGMATTAMAVGAERLHTWIRRFGFGERTGIELGGESPGQLSPPRTWPQIQVANIGFGQGVSVTAIQLLSAYCVVANGGRRIHPHVVKQVTDPDGKIQQTSGSESEAILSPTTCERMRSVLEKVVTEGTGKRAGVPGRRVAGKTGTAQKPLPGIGFKSGLFTASFVGFAPVSDPRIAIIIVIDEPKASHYGGVVAAPAFRGICERTLAYLRVPPDAPLPNKTIASATGRD